MICLPRCADRIFGHSDHRVIAAVTVQAMRTQSSSSQPISNPSELAASVGPIDRDAAIATPHDAAAGLAAQKQAPLRRRAASLGIEPVSPAVRVGSAGRRTPVACRTRSTWRTAFASGRPATARDVVNVSGPGRE